MIYTVTLNPAVDYMMYMDTLHTGRINRSKYESVYYGGKGINVSIVLKNMNVDSIVMGLIGGFTGIQLKSDIEQRGIKTDMIMLEKGITRINIKINADVSTELNGAGPEVGENDIQKIYNRIDKLKDGDILVLSGSVPRGVKKTVYADIMGCLVHKDINVAVDTTGELLLNTLKYKPFIVKPNINELGEIFGKRIIENKEVIYYGKIIQSMGARNVLISMGERGAILLSENGEVYGGKICGGEVRGTVGAGDSMTAGFIKGYSDSKDYMYALRMGLACGSATAYSYGLAEGEKIKVLLDEVENIL